RGLGGGIGCHAGTDPPFERRTRRNIDDPPPPTGAADGVDRSSAREEAAHEIDFDLLHQLRLAGLGHWRHGEPAGNVNRRPPAWNVREERIDCPLVGKVEGPDLLAPLAVAI